MPNGSDPSSLVAAGERSWNLRNPARLARKVASSSRPVAMYPKCAGGTFLRITGSKSNTLSASFGLAIGFSASRGAHTIGSGGARVPATAAPP